MTHLRDGFYWFVSERASFPTIAQRIGSRWYLVDEEGHYSLEEIERRGWKLHGRVKGQNRQYPKVKR